MLGLWVPGVGMGAGGEPVVPEPAVAEFLHSPADIIRRMLIALGEGADPPATPWPIYTAAEPDNPDNVITTYDTAGRKDGRAMIDGTTWEHHGIQVRIRSTTHSVGWIKARELARALDAVNWDTILIDASEYLVHAVSRETILTLGKNVPTSKRSLFTINAVVSLKPL